MITSSDFTGYHAIAQNPDTQTRLTEYITLYMRQYLVELLGYELYQLFIADLDVDNVPQTERFTVIFEALSIEGAQEVWIPYGVRKSRCFDDNRDEAVEPTFSEGIIAMLKGFIFFEFVNEYGLSVSQTGVVINKDENSEPANGKGVALIESRYNRSIKSFKVIRRYILDHLSDYPEYKGIEKDSSYWGGAF